MMKDIEDKSRSDGAKDGQAEDGSQEMDHSIDKAKGGPRDEDGIAHSMEDAIADPLMETLRWTLGRRLAQYSVSFLNHHCS